MLNAAMQHCDPYNMHEPMVIKLQVTFPTIVQSGNFAHSFGVSIEEKGRHDYLTHPKTHIPFRLSIILPINVQAF